MVSLGGAGSGLCICRREAGLVLLPSLEVLPQPPPPSPSRQSASRGRPPFSKSPALWTVGGQPAPRWQRSGPCGGVSGLGGLRSWLMPAFFSSQTSSPIEVTGRASAVHPLYQKAPGVGGCGGGPRRLVAATGLVPTLLGPSCRRTWT